MQRLNLMTLAAIAIGFGAYAYDAASAQTRSTCPTYESTVYFAPNSASLNEFSDYTINKMATDAKACGAKGVVVEAAADGERAKIVADALRTKGIKAVIVPAPALAQSAETILNRAVVLRVATPRNVQS
jgi:hypothetical protein